MRSFPLALGGLFLGATLSAAPAASAQTTHEVFLFTVSFFPEAITIEVGDTVRWTWVTGQHDVKSGSGGVPDGIFDSGAPVSNPPGPFEVTFDAAFLAANPVQDNIYHYYCTEHMPVMVASVTVNVPTIDPDSFTYGSGVNPAGSLAILAGEPKLGTVVQLGTSNTANSSSSAAFCFLAFAVAPAPFFPAGLVLPGWGMLAGSPGELLVAVDGFNPFLQLGPVLWPGGTAPAAPFNFPLPALPELAGVTLFTQGVLAFPEAGIFRLGLTNGLGLVLGN